MTITNRAIIILIGVVILIGVGAVASRGRMAAYAQQSKPCGMSATEIFHLRSECRGLGEQLANEKRQESPKNSVSYISHFASNANRCYVRIWDYVISDDHTYTMTKYTLYDAQSMDVLAWTCFIHPSKAGEKPTYMGNIKDDMTDSTYVAYSKAEDFMNRHMKE
jgi:hypothetical protein